MGRVYYTLSIDWRLSNSFELNIVFNHFCTRWKGKKI